MEERTLHGHFRLALSGRIVGHSMKQNLLRPSSCLRLNTRALKDPSPLDDLVWIHCSVGDEMLTGKKTRKKALQSMSVALILFMKCLPY
jgi:hypothetical protein